MTEHDQSLLLSMVEQLRDDLAEDRVARRDENEAARQSRAGTHGRIDEMIDRLGRIDITVALSGQVDAQVRNEIDALKKSVDGLNLKVDGNQASIAPTLDEWKRIRTLGLGVVGLIATGGISFGAAVAWGGDTVTHWVRAWLGIH